MGGDVSQAGDLSVKGHGRTPMGLSLQLLSQNWPKGLLAGL